MDNDKERYKYLTKESKRVIDITQSALDEMDKNITEGLDKYRTLVNDHIGVTYSFVYMRDRLAEQDKEIMELKKGRSK